MSAALVNRSLSTLKTELEFLRDSDVISQDFYDKVVSKLPDRYKAGASPITFEEPELIEVTTMSSVTTTATNPSGVSGEKPPLPQGEPLKKASTGGDVEIVEAMYDYSPQQPEDLQLHVGDKVKVLEHTSADWWKGAVNGREGMFPSNYVKRVEAGSRAPPAPSYEQSQQQSQYNQQQFNQPQPYNTQYAQPQPYNQFAPQQQYYNQVQPYQQQMAPQQPQQVVVQGQQQQQSTGASGHIKKFGSKLGNAAIFGAGATIGSDIVNSIF